MIVGTEITCPSCQQNDATQKVSMLVNMISQEMTPQQIDTLAKAIERGEASEWKGNPKEGSWKQLAEQLKPPPKPEIDSLAKMGDRFMHMRGVQFLSFLF